MNFIDFKKSQQQTMPPSSLSDSLRALWYAGKGDWHAAHDIVENLSSRDAAWVHAYLHREEGDQWNANYWYRRAAKVMPAVSLEKEWEELVKALL